MKTDPVNDAWDVLIGAQPYQQALGEWRLLLVAVFLVLLAASAVIALIRYVRDPDQRGSKPFFVWLCRVTIGAMWFQASLWKLPLPVSDALPPWLQMMAENAAYPFLLEFVRDVLLTHLTIVDPVLFGLEMLLAISFMLGLAVRFMGGLGVLYALALWLGLYRTGAAWEYVVLAIAQGQFTVIGAGRFLGLDRWNSRLRMR